MIFVIFEANDLLTLGCKALVDFDPYQWLKQMQPIETCCNWPTRVQVQYFKNKLLSGEPAGYA